MEPLRDLPVSHTIDGTPTGGDDRDLISSALAAAGFSSKCPLGFVSVCEGSSLQNLVELRRHLHQHPELSGCEKETARTICKFFEELSPDRTLAQLGGSSLAFVFSGDQPGPTVMLRCELDALPIDESSNLPYRSSCPGVSHKCGHDGHMSILAGVGQTLSRRRPQRGRVVLLYQAAEETGQGAQMVIDDERFAEIQPDLGFALHNLPGYPLGQVIFRPGVFCCASRGMIIRLRGRSAHAAQPRTGISPARAMCDLVGGLAKLTADQVGSDKDLGFVTVVGAKLGQKAFGTAPERAAIFATLRSDTDQTMDRLVFLAEQLAKEISSRDSLSLEISYEDVFPVTENGPRAVEIIGKAFTEGEVLELERPMPWSEDFGRFGAVCDIALFGLGAGDKVPPLHDLNYDFPDQLIEVGHKAFLRIVNECLG